MKLSARLLASVLVPASLAASAVELPPPPNLKTSPPTNYWAPGTAMSAYVIQTNSGRVECPRRWYEAEACRPYIPGRDRRARAFVRQEAGIWKVCPYPAGAEGCVGIRDFPNMVEQD